MDDDVYWIGRAKPASSYAEYPHGFKPIKAKDVSAWLVERMTASVSPNLYFTRDFKSFKKLSYVEPERNYNWLTTELVTWKMANGQLSQGILYKPENFDYGKKYPSILTYYEKRSDQLNEFIPPDYAVDRMNIPSYVSRGYLVFVPDIYYSPGHNGDAVGNAVVSAAEYLSRLHFVDAKKLGLMGHSFAGWETNYLITHSHLFAAACEAAGVSDQVSAYAQLNYGTWNSRQQFYETDAQGSAYGLDVTPWTRPDLYIGNSPIFRIGDITTPLLMMHCAFDSSVPFEQAIELFTGMKRAGKKVWLLQYDNDGHDLNPEHAKDYTIRMQQFFDHYLKDAAAPHWMGANALNDKDNSDDDFALEPGVEP